MLMFKPISTAGKLFGSYLRMKNHPAKIRIQNWLGNTCFKDGIIFTGEDKTIFKLNANDWITRTILIEGSYEKASVALAVQIMREGKTMVDIGANFGLFSSQVCVNNRKAKVLAVEPNYQIIPLLINNLRLNKIESQVQVIQAAVSGSANLVALEQPSENNMGSTTVVNNNQALLSVPCITLENICTQFNVEKVDLVKIDIEGNEFDVFKDFDFQKIELRNIILEFNHLSKISLNDLLEFFRTKGFEPFTVYNAQLFADIAEIPENNIWFKNIRQSA